MHSAAAAAPLSSLHVLAFAITNADRITVLMMRLTLHASRHNVVTGEGAAMEALPSRKAENIKEYNNQEQRAGGHCFMTDLLASSKASDEGQ